MTDKERDRLVAGHRAAIREALHEENEYHERVMQDSWRVAWDEVVQGWLGSNLAESLQDPEFRNKVLSNAVRIERAKERAKNAE